MPIVGVETGVFLGGLIDDFVDAAGGAVDAVVVVAFAGVGPVGDEDVAVGAGEEVDAAEPLILGLHEVGGVFAGVAAAFAFQFVHVDAVAVEVAGEHGAVVFFGPVAALVDEHADVGVAAAEFEGLVADALADVGPFFGAGVPVEVVGGLLDDFVDVRVQVGAEHAAVVGAGDDVPEVADDGVDHEELAIGIPVVAPGVGPAVRDGFDDFAGGVVAPDGAVDFEAFVHRGAGGADGGGVGDAVAAVEPAVGAPAEAVDDVVADGFGVEAVEEDLGFGVGGVVAVLIGYEGEGAGVEDPGAAVAVFDGGEVGAVFPEHFAFVVFAVAVGVFEDEDAVAEGGVPAVGVFGVGVVFGDPEAAACVPGHGDGLLDIGFGGEDEAFEAGGELHGGGGFLGGHGGAFFGVEGGGEGGCGERRAEGAEECGEEKEGMAHGGCGESNGGEVVIVHALGGNVWDGGGC